MPLTTQQAGIIKGLLARGEKQHDIAAYFRCNGGRVAEISTGEKFPGIPVCTRNLPTLSAKPEIDQARRALRAAKQAIEKALASLDQYEEHG